MARKNVKTTNLLGAVPQLVQFITNHSTDLTEQGLNPEALKTKLGTCSTDVQATEQSQANAKTTLKVATQTHNDTVAQRYPEFSSVIDLLRGAVGNNTALGKQLTNIRKQATRQASRAASNVIDVNASAKKAA